MGDVTRYIGGEVGSPQEQEQLSIIREGQAQWVSIDPERCVDVVGSVRLYKPVSSCSHFVIIMGSNNMC